MDIEKTIRALTGRGFAVQHFATGREAADYLDGAIDGTTVGIGGSKTIDQIGLYDRLARHNTVWRPDRPVRPARQTQHRLVALAHAGL